MKSAVIVSRNDNYGGNLAKRATMCLNSMTKVFDEVVYVDWNSPGRSLIEEIRPELQKTGRIKHIIVTPAEARKLVPDPQAQDCCEVMGRNIGIRRARGEFIVSTNIDIIPTPFDDSTLPRDHMWTAARYDVGTWVWGTTYFESHVPNLLAGLKLSEKLPQQPDADDGSLVRCCGDFQLAHVSVWNAIRGFEEAMFYRGFADTNVMIKAKLAGYFVRKLNYTCYHLNHYDAAYDEMLRVKPSNDKERFTTQFKLVTANSEFWGSAHNSFAIEIF